MGMGVIELLKGIVRTINGLGGNVTLTSNGGTVTITTPTSDTINLESSGGGGGGGTVTSVSVTTANGISGTVATATTTPAISLDISALDASKIADGTVSSAEFQYINSLSSNAQTQINGKQATLSGASLTAVTVAGTDKVLIQDVSDSDNLKTVTAQSIADLSPSLGDGDKGDITVSSSGTVWTIDNDAVTYAKMQNVSATDKILGRSTAGAGDIEEIACTAAGRALIDDADATAQRTTLGLGTLATQSGTFSGTSSGTNTGDQTTVSGNAGTATALQNARTIGGVSFDGTANIVPQTIQSINEATDTTCFPLFISASGTQSLQPLNNTALTFNSNTGLLSSTSLGGTLTTASQTNITGVGTITTGTWNATDIAVADGGTGRSTSTTAYGLIAAGTTATGAHQTLAAGATTEILVGGGAAALPIWTTAQGSGAPVRATSPTLTTPVLGVASATSLAISAATPLLLTNGQLVNIALTSQTVGATTLTIPDFASVADEFTFKTKAQTMSNKTFVAPVLGAATATSINGNTFTTGTYTLTGTAAKTLNFTNSLTLTGTDGTTMTFPSTSATIARTDAANTFTGVQTMTSPAITTPAITGLATGSGVSATATVSTLASRDSSGNSGFNNTLEGYATIPTAGATTTLTVASKYNQFFTGTLAQTVTLPDVTTLVLGHTFNIDNASTGNVTVNSSGGNAVLIVAGGTSAQITCIAITGTGAASWKATYFADIVTSGAKLNIGASLTLTGTSGTTMTFPSTSATIARTDAANTFTGTQTIGALVATTLNGNTFTTGTYTLTGTAAKTLNFTNTLTLSGTDSTTMTFPSTSATIARTDAANTFTGVQTMTSPALTTPAITGLATGSGVASAATASTLASRDANGNSNFVNVLEGYSPITSAAGTTTLTVASNYQQVITGSTTQTVQMPVASTLVVGQSWQIVNNSTGAVTVNTSAGGANAITVLATGTSAVIECILASGTTTASWTVLNPLLQSANGGQLAGFRNYFINGDFKVWQRGTSFALTTTAGTYNADRWIAYQPTAAAGIANRDTSVPTTPATFLYSLKVGRTAANTATNHIYLNQVIESANCYSLRGQQVTLSFYAKAGANYSNAGSTLSAQLYTGTGVDQGGASIGTWTGAATPINQAPTLTTSWQRFSYTAILGATISEVAFQADMLPVGTAGADDNYYITGIQLEVGTVATPFENRPFSTEQDLCRRYYEKTFSYATAPAQNAGTTGAQAVLLPTGASGTFGLSVPMYPKRTAPTITTYNPSAANANWRDTTGSADRTVTVGTIGETSFVISGASGVAATTNLIHWAAAAEL